MRFLFLLVFLFSNLILYSQSAAIIADSIAKSYMRELPSKQSKGIFKDMLLRRNDLGVNERMDTTTYRYLYIEERFNPTDSTSSVVEYYFNSDTQGIYKSNYDDRDKLPDLLYQNDSLLDQRLAYYSSTITGVIYSDIFEYFHTRDTILNRCQSLKPVQEFSYDPTVAVFDYVYTGSRRDATLETIAELVKQKEIEQKKMCGSTYQMVTLIDKVNGKVIVSLQRPAVNAKVKVRVVEYKYSQW